MKTRKCCVKGCTSVKTNPKISFFKATKANHSAWNLAVSIANREETVVKHVCAEHFQPDDIIDTYSVPDNVTKEIRNRIRIGLKKGSVPSIFSSVDKLCNEFVPSVDDLDTDHNYYSNCSVSYQVHNILENLFANEVISEDIEPYKLNDKPLHKQLKSFEIPTGNNVEILTFNDLTVNFKNTVLPEGWTSYSSNDKIVFYKPKLNGDKMKIEKQIVFKSTLEICVYVYQFTIQTEKISSTLKYPISLISLSELITILDLKKICGGGPRSKDFPGVLVRTATLEYNKLWRHQKCSILINIKAKRCPACNFLVRYFEKLSKKVKLSKHIQCTPPTKCSIVENLKKSNSRLRTIIRKYKMKQMLNKTNLRFRKFKLSSKTVKRTASV